MLYSSRRRRGFFDRDVATDELVLTLDRDRWREGAVIPFSEARYQRGARQLTYVSRAVEGELRLDTLREGRAEGRAKWVSRSPALDLADEGQCTVETRFSIERHDNWT